MKSTFLHILPFPTNLNDRSLLQYFVSKMLKSVIFLLNTDLVGSLSCSIFCGGSWSWANQKVSDYQTLYSGAKYAVIRILTLYCMLIPFPISTTSQATHLMIFIFRN